MTIVKRIGVRFQWARRHGMHSWKKVGKVSLKFRLSLYLPWQIVRKKNRLLWLLLMSFFTKGLHFMCCDFLLTLFIASCDGYHWQLATNAFHPSSRVARLGACSSRSCLESIPCHRAIDDSWTKWRLDVCFKACCRLLCYYAMFANWNSVRSNSCVCACLWVAQFLCSSRSFEMRTQLSQDVRRSA